MKCNNRHDYVLLHKWVSRLLMTVCIAGNGAVVAGDLEKAKRMHDRLTGITAPSAAVDPADTTLTDMQALIASGTAIDAEDAARIAMNNSSFYNVTLKNFAAPWTNEEQTVFVPLNDYTATIIGMIKDDVDFRQVLSGNILYTGAIDGVVVTQAYSRTNNTHYEQLEQTDLKTTLIAGDQTVTGLDATATAGVMTTRAAARSFFEGGTNRAMFRFTLMNHLCTDLEPLKDVTRVPDHVRRDVSRSPGGDSRIFMNNCVGCHAGMDGLAGAFAKYEWDGSQLLYDDVANTSGLYDASGNGVSLKHNINATNFKYGHAVVDDSWVNYWRNGQNSLLGWGALLNGDGKGHETGNGAKALGVELANSSAFASCQVKKAFKAVCFRNPDDYTADRALVSAITGGIGSGPIIMKDVFAKVAVHCMDNPVAP